MDFIIAVKASSDQEMIVPNKLEELLAILGKSEGKEIELQIFNLLSRKTRSVTLVPNKNWENADSLLGVLIRYEDYTTAPDRVFRIVAVSPDSPAALAGFIPEEDFLLGSSQTLYNDLAELSTYLELTQGSAIKSLEIVLYNAKAKTLRSTFITPRKNWGGPGLLGCEFGMGYLNILPVVDENELQLLTNSATSSPVMSNGIIRIPTITPEKYLLTHSESRLISADDLSGEIANQRMKQLKSTKPVAHKPIANHPAIDVHLPKEHMVARRISEDTYAHWKERPERVISEPVLHRVHSNQEESKTTASTVETPNNATIKRTNIRSHTTIADEILTKPEIKPVEFEPIEMRFKGYKRFRHETDTNQRMPFVIARANENEKLLSVIDQTGARRRQNSLVADEKNPQMIKVVQYTFFSKKLNHDYVIKSVQLFDLEKILKLDPE